MTAFQAFIDDSASEKSDRRLFLAGYFNRTDQWEMFAIAWAEELQNSPAITHLKMSDANSLKGEFEGWSEELRDEKLKGLARVTRHFNPFSFHFSISREQNSRLLKPFSPRGIGNPHFIAVFGIVSMLAQYLHQHGLRHPVDFVFDKQRGVSEDIDIVFDYMCKNLHRGPRSLVPRNPSFGDDRIQIQLQAADMLAWHIRREHEDGVEFGSLPLTKVLTSSSHLYVEVTEDHLSKWSQKFRELPNISLMQSKTQWQEIRKVMRQLKSAGFKPPYGTTVANVSQAFLSWIRNLTGKF